MTKNTATTAMLTGDSCQIKVSVAVVCFLVRTKRRTRHRKYCKVTFCLTVAQSLIVSVYHRVIPESWMNMIFWNSRKG